MKRIVKNSIIILLVLSIIGLIAFDRYNMSAQWIEKNKPIQSDLLIIERWIPPVYYPNIAEEFNKHNYHKLIITGKESLHNVPFSRNGTLVLKNLPETKIDSLSRISIKLKGSYAKNSYSICQISRNEKIIWENEVINDQKVILDIKILPGDSLTLAFINDAHEGKLDRNLSIKQVNINRKPLNIFANGNYILSGKEKKIIPFNNIEDLSAVRLNAEGIPKEKIVSLAAKRTGLSKTYNNALATHNWMAENNYTSANILTLSYHSNRTFYSFKKANPKIKFGVKTIHAYATKARTIKEIVGNFFIRITPKIILDQPSE